ncbi:MAG TPA: PAS domain S-box protein, partial [Rhodanobacter sp.]
MVAPDDYPPFLSLDADGKPQGYEVDRWKLFQAHTGIRVELVTMDWAAATQALLSGQADVIDMIYHTSAREAQYDFSPPYATLPTGVYVDRSVEGVHDLPSLQGLQVGVGRGDACGPKLRSLGFTALREFRDAHQLVRAAIRGSPRAFCMDENRTYRYLSEYAALGRFERAFVLNTSQFHWAVRKGNTAMLQTVERGMAAIAPAELATLDRRWLEHPLIPEPYRRATGIVLAAVLALIVLMLLWVWTLRRTVAVRTAALRAEEGKLRAIFDASPDAMWVKDLQGIYRDGNDRAVALFRASCESPTGRRCDELFDAAFAARMRELDGEAARLGRNAGALLSLTVGNGQNRQFEVISAPLFTPQGELYSVVSAARDVTERQLAETQLQLWGHAFENAAFGVYICDARSKILISANPTFAREHGYTPAEMVGMPVDALYPPDLVAERVALRAASDRLDHYVWETEQVAKDGRRFPVRLDCSVFHDADGLAQYVLIHAQDISERKQAENELRLAAVAFETQEASMVLDAGQVIQRVNHAFTKFTGFRSD